MKNLIVYSSLIIVLISCNNSTNTVNNNEGKGGKIYGGKVNISEAEVVKTIVPYSLTILSASHVSSQIFEGLVRLNPKDLSVEPLLAEKWEIDPSGTKYTFYLKKGALFHNDPCFKNGTGRENMHEYTS